ncbi:MAG: tRNA glutamyl-Q(34) synthetase GluQRS [Steroidobacteraceae bacterium]
MAGYVGRFAPSPTGDLHVGSLYTAAASYLDARAHGGRWLVRMEDVDRSREVAGAAAGILRTLEAFGFEWDGGVWRQSDRGEPYAAVLEDLRSRGLTFQCSCSRQDLADEERYPGFCRGGPRNPGAATATRLRVDPETIGFDDRLQGAHAQDVAAAVGDAILKRRDGYFSYLLAVVVDDAAQGVTHVVRGADLLHDTPRQIYLQRKLALPVPRYAHVPVLVEPDGSKLAKSTRSVPADRTEPSKLLLEVLHLLGLAPPPGLIGAPVSELWAWAQAHWTLNRLYKRLALPLEGSEATPIAIGKPGLP